MVEHWVIDENGWIFDPESQRFLNYLGTDRTFTETKDLLLQQMGFIHVANFSHCPHVSFKADIVSIKAILALISWISDNGVSRIAYADPTDPKHQSLIQSQSAILKFLSGGHERIDVKPVVTPLPLAGSYFARLWEPARIIAGAAIDEATRLRALGDLLGDLYVIAQRDTKTGRYVIKHNGAKYKNYCNRIGAMRVGEPFENLEAKSYGRWLSDTFAVITPANRPKVEKIEVFVAPSASIPTRMCYSRLLIPYSMDGVDHILTGSVLH
ncbi:MAG: hypothetical protein ABL898_08830 [Hyphomicrobiaceae bacterium]|nr:hypothetical protein [Hyphomicrobiaceae bacterium]